MLLDSELESLESLSLLREDQNRGDLRPPYECTICRFLAFATEKRKKSRASGAKLLPFLFLGRLLQLLPGCLVKIF